MSAALDPATIQGKLFGRWTPIHRVGKNRNGQFMWLCRCTCGTTREIAQGSFLRGGMSCGCASRERWKRVGLANRKHVEGTRSSPEYRAWVEMIRRCNDRNRREYHHYGGRGITVCERWRDFPLFLKDVGPRPSTKHSLDRIDVNGNYEPGNIRWATWKEQENNRRNNRLIRAGDVIGTMAEWVEVTGLSSCAIRLRLKKGWDPVRAVLTPADPRKAHPGPRVRMVGVSHTSPI